jgi:acyl-CoA reductase-like NAD-dependent aldehyde dehydrogenase
MTELHSQTESATADASGPVPHLPALRRGAWYESLETVPVKDCRTGDVVAEMSRVTAGMIRRDLKRVGEDAAALAALPAERLVAICAEEADRFLHDELPLNGQGDTHGPDDYVRALGATSGLADTLCRRNMEKIATVLGRIPDIIRGLGRGLDLRVLDDLVGEQAGVRVSIRPATDALGVVLPSNSPTVNSIWLPAVALKVPVVLKPGSEEPWTPLRIIQALVRAGCPAEAFSFYPTDHEGGAAVLDACGRALVFGDESTVSRYASNPAVQVHGPGRSKVIIGPDEIDRWADHLDVLVESIRYNGGRSCICASTIVVPSRGDEVATALAEVLAKETPRGPHDPDALLAAFAKPAMAEFMDAKVEEGLAAGGARDVTADFRSGPRRVETEHGTFVLPTIVRCDTITHPLGATELLFPFASVVEISPERTVDAIGPTLVASAITRDRGLLDGLLRARHVDRLNVGPLPTTYVEWEQPHEGNLFEFLYDRRAIQREGGW